MFPVNALLLAGSTGLSDDTFYTIFNKISEPMAIHGFQENGMPDRFLEVNPAACNRYKYTREEFLQIYPTEIDSPFVPKDIQKIQTDLMTKGCATFECYHTAKDNEQFPVEINTTIFNHKGQKMAVTLIRDISKRKAAENLLQESEEKYRTLTENLPGIIYRMYLQKGRRMEFYNDMLPILTAYPHVDIKAEKISSLNSFIHPEDKDFVFRAVHDAVENKNPYLVEYRLQIRDGLYCDVIERGRPIYDTDGKPLYIDGIISDISERKKAESALSEANRKLNILSSITRHDILNQISAAEMYIDIMEMEGAVLPDTEAAKNLKIISSALQTIERQIGFTRDYQDLGAKNPDWQNVGLIIDKISAGVFNKLILLNDIKNIEIFADPLFEKVIFNLIDNALRHGNTLTKVCFRSEEAKEGLKLICEDDGVGVVEDVKEKIFKRQYYQHTGLGLFLSREILSITGMSITETGVPGKGAKFEILVPDGMWRTFS